MNVSRFVVFFINLRQLINNVWCLVFRVTSVNDSHSLHLSIKNNPNPFMCLPLFAQIEWNAKTIWLEGQSVSGMTCQNACKILCQYRFERNNITLLILWLVVISRASAASESFYLGIGEKKL